MPLIEVKIPALGESITGGVLAKWHVPDGALVRKDQPLFELETDKITSEGTAEVAGRVALKVAAGAEVKVGEIVATIEVMETAVRTPETGAAAPATTEAAPPTETRDPKPKIQNAKPETPTSPAVREAVETAWFEHRPLRLVYARKAWEPRARVVKLRNLVFDRAHTLLNCVDLETGEDRQFRMDRITTATVLEPLTA